jgi:hypothetical protein
VIRPGASERRVLFLGEDLYSRSATLESFHSSVGHRVTSWAEAGTVQNPGAFLPSFIIHHYETINARREDAAQEQTLAVLTTADGNCTGPQFRKCPCGMDEVLDAQ